MNGPDFTARRFSMVDHQIRGRGIVSPGVLAAMGRVRRENFVIRRLREQAYDDGPLPIGQGQTISQPYIVALMVEALGLENGAKVLDVGTGSGYGAAVLACIAGEVFSIERLATLARRARRTLLAERFLNVHVRCGDGTLGWPEEAPFQGIVVAAGGPGVPETLKQQLAVGGHLVMPVGSEFNGQALFRMTRLSRSDFAQESLGGVRFVPLRGAAGWPSGGD
ncbi:protein-L-isoaspartate(D-aspartate) O-methyltransferase [Marinobacter sp.]|uniref:protein-L-isoaspartate(D-aspartate) O-methyltransferase n=1 Tax=Marinobacter sp. TaxID=50741 RepID=UPI0034A1394D